MAPTTLGDATLAALDELRNTTITTIQYQTAITWAGRSMASFQLFFESGNFDRMFDGLDFMHEALEHAALSGDRALLDAIRGPLEVASERARHLAKRGTF